MQVSVYKEGNGCLEELWKEARACRYWLRSAEMMAWGVPETEGHDDFITSLALTCRAAEELAPPAISGLIRPPPDGEGSRW
jgi:hypothetical protein